VSRPTRETVGGRAYLDLQAKARREGRPTDELLVLYVLERFLYRLSISEHRRHLVLKGGMLLAAFDERRPTADVDLLGRIIGNDVDSVSRAVLDVLTIEVDDGVLFEPSGLRAQITRDADPYTGVRVTVPARVDRARHPLRVDINVGDPVTPGPAEVSYPALLGQPFTLVGYPLETVLAEKIVTMVDRGDATTRDRDFADVYVLSGRHMVDANSLAAAVRATGDHRASDLRPLRSVLVALASARQPD
jgi:Nucleotidyl transferase AbiEii toxin, Type IV TA system